MSTEPNTPTPRTDEVHRPFDAGFNGQVPVDFSRQLERELAKTEAEVTLLKWLLKWADEEAAETHSENAKLTAERDAITRERLLARWKTKASPPGSSNTELTGAKRPV